MTGRRGVLSGLALCGLLSPAAGATRDAGALPGGATLLVAGPPGGDTDRWAEALGRALSPVRLRRDAVGGADGVTGANQFEARTAPDGDTALLAPGTAAIAWLAGDQRAQFDAGRWVPLLAGVGSGVLVSRVAVQPGAPVRMAVGQVAGAELPGVLGLDMLGAAVEPVVGLGGADAREALVSGQVDAVFLHGPGTATTVQALAVQGIPALFTLGVTDEGGQLLRDRQLPFLPTFPEVLARRQAPAGRLFAAWRAAATAAVLDVVLVLQRETPAAAVSQWRRACVQAAASPEMQAAAASQEAMPVASLSASAAAVAIEADTMLELRRWMGQRLGWHPG